MTYVIAEPCVDVLDKSCIEECPVDCIYEGARMLYIHPDECVDCGACEPVCPVEAIYYEDDVPDQWAPYTAANVDFFDELGSPGGASKVGKTDKDVGPAVSLPPQGGVTAGRSTAPGDVAERSSTAGRRLPDFPWDSLAGAAATARAHPDGVVDLSVGTPVDPVPDAIGAALRDAWDSPGYPATWGTAALREAAVAALERRHGVSGVVPDAVLPTVGSKELVAWLPTLLGLGAGDVVAQPALAYPTYEVGALLAGAEPVRVDDDEPLPAGTRLLWLNSPSNPTGRVLGADALCARVAEARAAGAVVAADECYLALPGPGVTTTSVLDPAVHGGDPTGLLAVHSLSKTANLAGYRAGFVAGDPALVADLLAIRKHAGMIVPRPVQQAMTAALGDDEHVAATRARYDARRAVLRPALEAAGFTVEHSEAGLYLWATRDEPCRDTVAWLAERGVLVAPGEFYGDRGARHVRVGLTATDERIAAAAARL